MSVGIGVVNFVGHYRGHAYHGQIPQEAADLRIGDDDHRLAVLAVLNFTGDVATLAVPTMVLIACYILGFALSWGPIAWVLIGEIFPLSVRGIGSSFGSAANWLGNFVVSQFFLMLLAMFKRQPGIDLNICSRPITAVRVIPTVDIAMVSNDTRTVPHTGAAPAIGRRTACRRQTQPRLALFSMAKVSSVDATCGIAGEGTAWIDRINRPYGLRSTQCRLDIGQLPTQVGLRRRTIVQ